MAKTYSAIQTITAAGGESSVTFTNIPQNYTDLKVAFSSRVSGTGDRSMTVTFSGSSTGYSYRAIYGTGSGVSPTTATGQSNLWIGYSNNASDTSSTFSNCDFYVYNYTSTSNAKAVLGTAAWETNATANIDLATVGLWSIGTQVGVSSITFTPASGTLIAGSTFTLYGVGSGFKASGGTCYYSNGYAYHVFNSTSAFVPSQSINADILVVSGGGGGGAQLGAATQGSGAGAGGLLYFTSQPLSAATSYTITVGGGGSPATAFNNTGAQGGSSQFGSLTAPTGGGYGAGTANGGSGGSGGGGGGDNSVYSGGSGTSGQGYAGSAGTGGGAATRGAGGGGGAGGAAGAPSTATGGAGGIGLYYDAFGSATGTGQYVSGHYYYAGGGGGGGYTVNGLGGAGGGGTSGVIGSYNQPKIPMLTSTTAGAGLPNTGGGGGGTTYAGTPYTLTNPNSWGGNGGSGIVIVRYPMTDSFTLA